VKVQQRAGERIRERLRQALAGWQFVEFELRFAELMGYQPSSVDAGVQRQASAHQGESRRTGRPI
jgi:hypothetical protein